MALASTIYVFTLRLADADRNLYETLNLRVARHPSESAEYLLTRLLAFCLLNLTSLLVHLAVYPFVSAFHNRLETACQWPLAHRLARA